MYVCIFVCIYMYVCVYIFARSVNCHNPWRKVIVLPYLTNGGKVCRLFEMQNVEKFVQDYIAGKWQRQDSNLGSSVPESTPLTTAPSVQPPLCVDALLLLWLLGMALRTTAAFRLLDPRRNLGGTDRLQNAHHTPLWPSGSIRRAQELFQFGKNPARLEQRREISQALYIQEAPVSMTGSPGPLFWPEVL